MNRYQLHLNHFLYELENYIKTPLIGGTPINDLNSLEVIPLHIGDAIGKFHSSIELIFRFLTEERNISVPGKINFPYLDINFGRNKTWLNNQFKEYLNTSSVEYYKYRLLRHARNCIVHAKSNAQFLLIGFFENSPITMIDFFQEILDGNIVLYNFPTFTHPRKMQSTAHEITIERKTANNLTAKVQEGTMSGRIGNQFEKTLKTPSDLFKFCLSWNIIQGEIRYKPIDPNSLSFLDLEVIDELHLYRTTLELLDFYKPRLENLLTVIIQNTHV